MHADEAVQAARARDLWEEGRYVYDPDEYHGPTLQYATLLGLWAGGQDDFAGTTKATLTAAQMQAITRHQEMTTMFTK